MLAAAALIGVGGMAYADNGTRQEQAACRPDVRRFCGHLTHGDNQKYRECLQAHLSELSQRCRKVLMKHRDRQ